MGTTQAPFFSEANDRKSLIVELSDIVSVFLIIFKEHLIVKYRQFQTADTSEPRFNKLFSQFKPSAPPSPKLFCEVYLAIFFNSGCPLLTVIPKPEAANIGISFSPSPIAAKFSGFKPRSVANFFNPVPLLTDLCLRCKANFESI